MKNKKLPKKQDGGYNNPGNLDSESLRRLLEQYQRHIQQRGRTGIEDTIPRRGSERIIEEFEQTEPGRGKWSGPEGMKRIGPDSPNQWIPIPEQFRNQPSPWQDKDLPEEMRLDIENYPPAKGGRPAPEVLDEETIIEGGTLPEFTKRRYDDATRIMRGRPNRQSGGQARADRLMDIGTANSYKMGGMTSAFRGDWKNTKAKNNKKCC